MFRLDNKIAVITGGGSGIGKAIATTFAKQGAIIHIIELGEDNAREVVTDIEREGGSVFVHPCNVVNQQEVLSVFKKTGAINILVNNAGIAHAVLVLQLPGQRNRNDLHIIMRMGTKTHSSCYGIIIQYP
jgi:NAD(P)-dependent dehydrogenase (short-subunit alcohol dehydrogenase family)